MAPRWAKRRKKLATRSSKVRVVARRGDGAACLLTPRTRVAACSSHFSRAAGRYSEAAEAYSEAMRLCPDNLTYVNNRAAAYLMSEQYARCVKDCETVLAVQPRDVKALLRCGKALVRRGETDQARARLEAAKREEPTNKQVEEELAAVAVVETSLKEAREAVREGKGRQALEACTRGTAKAPYCPQLRLAQAEALLLLRQWGAAGQIAVGLLRDNARNPDALYVRGAALYQAGQLDEALALWAEALRCDPDHAKAAKARKAARGIAALRTEAKQFAATGRHAQAHGLLTKALASDPGNAKLAAVLALERARSGKRAGFEEQALSDVGQFLAENPNDEEAREMRLELLGRLGRHREVVMELRQRAQEDPEDMRVRRRLMQAEAELKQAERPDYYKILGIAKTATEAEIKKAYKRGALQYHPDKVAQESDAQLRAAAESKFRQINEANAVLSDPRKRAAYDRGDDIDELDQDDGHGHGHGHGHGGFGGFHGHPAANDFFRQYAQQQQGRRGPF